MEGLKELRARLISVQQKAPGNKLSERNVVEIMQKLVEKYKLELIFTLSGKEYLTPSRLMQDIIREVTNEGRVNLLELPNVLNVSIEHLELYAASITNKDIFLINGHLMSSFYIENLCQEINLNLQEFGQVTLSELTYKYSLPATFLKEQIEKRLGSTIKAQFSKNNTLVTDTYLIRHLGKLRGALRAITKPYDLKAYDQSLVVLQVNELINSGQIKGTLDGIIFIPQVYQNTVWDEIQSYYFVNKYIEYDFIKRRLAYIDDNDYKSVCNKLGNGENLTDCYINVELIDDFKNRVKEIMRNKNFMDFFDLEFPSCISEDDFEGFLSEGIYNASHYIYTNSALEQAVLLLNPLILAFTEESKEQVKGKKKDSVLSIEIILAELKKKKYLNAPIEFLEGFSDAVYSKVREKITALRENRSKPAELVPDNVFQDFSYLYLCNKSLVTIQKQYSNIKPIQAHLSKTLAGNLLTDMLKIELLHHKIHVDSIKPNDRPKYISKLPDYLKEIFSKLSEKVSSKDLEGFITDLLANIKDIPIISLKAVDKKTERMIMHKIKSDFRAKVKKHLEENNFIEAGVSGLRLKLLENGILLDIPTEKWGINTILEVSSAIMTHDITLDFLKLASENCEKSLLIEMIPEFTSLLSLTS